MTDPRTNTPYIVVWLGKGKIPKGWKKAKKKDVKAYIKLLKNL